MIFFGSVRAELCVFRTSNEATYMYLYSIFATPPHRDQGRQKYNERLQYRNLENSPARFSLPVLAGFFSAAGLFPSARSKNKKKVHVELVSAPISSLYQGSCCFAAKKSKKKTFVTQAGDTARTAAWENRKHYLNQFMQ